MDFSVSANQQPAATANGTHNNAATTADNAELLSPLEQEVLDEYAKLVGNLDNVCVPSAFMACFCAQTLTGDL
jgi:hypothetical protein